MSARTSNTLSVADDFFRYLHDANQRTLILDYDGTLAPFRENPADAEPYPGVRERLDAIMESTDTRVVIVSGRWTKDLIPLVNLRQTPEIWGSHGWEQLLPSGRYELAPIGTGALRSLIEADTWGDEVRNLGAWCEHKPGALAIHWRGLSLKQIVAIQRLVSEKWATLELGKELLWHDFDGGIELRAPGRNKGYVVNMLLANQHDGVAAYLGDDNTDEDAFKAIKGRGLAVLVRPTYRPTTADLWLRPPEQLLEFLERWCAACRQSENA